MQKHAERVRTVEEQCHEQIKEMTELYGAVYNVSGVGGAETTMDLVASLRPGSTQRTDRNTLLDTALSGHVNGVDPERRSLAGALSQLRDRYSVCQQELKGLQDDAKRYQEAIQEEKKEKEKVTAQLAEERKVNLALQNLQWVTQRDLALEKQKLSRLRQRGEGICHELRLD